jgi:hypothetical protein
MNINEIIKEIDLQHFTFDGKKTLVCESESDEAVAEFTKINDILEKHKVPYIIININCIVLDI